MQCVRCCGEYCREPHFGRMQRRLTGYKSVRDKKWISGNYERTAYCRNGYRVPFSGPLGPGIRHKGSEAVMRSGHGLTGDQGPDAAYFTRDRAEAIHARCHSRRRRRKRRATSPAFISMTQIRKTIFRFCFPKYSSPNRSERPSARF